MLAMNHKKAVAAEIAKKTIKAAKKEKTRILDGFIDLTGYNRTYGARILRNGPGRLIGYVISGGKKIRYVISKKKKRTRERPRTYDHDVFLALKRIWTLFDFICGKRLAPFMADSPKGTCRHHGDFFSYMPDLSHPPRILLPPWTLGQCLPI